MKPENLPSEAELIILQALWDNPMATVHTVHECVLKKREVGYTTILKQLQRMFDKGLVSREKQGKQHLYSAVLDRTVVESSLLNRLSDSVFGGSSIRLAIRALGEEAPSADELDELQQWLDQQKNKRS